MKNQIIKLLCIVGLIGFLSSCTEELVKPKSPEDPASGQATPAKM